jgi:hypothetical protein
MATKKTTTKKAVQLPSLDPARIKKQLMEALKDAGLYRPSHAFLLESCAFSIAYMRRVERELRALDSLIVDKVSREGNSTPVPHALNPMYIQAVETVRRNLSEILATPKAATANTRTRKDVGMGDAEDNLAKLMSDLNAMADDD